MTIAFEDFSLDTAKAEMRRAGVLLKVEPQVFDLIAYLARNSDHVVSRDELIENVWQGRIVSDAAISTRINAARVALADDGKTQRLIKTVPRRGFRFALAPDVSGGTPAAGPDVPISGIRYCQSFDGTNLAYETFGEGPPLIKASSFLTHLEFEHSSPVWSHWIKELSRDSLYVRYDQRGNGLSDRDADEISFDAFVEDLKAVMDALGIKKAPLLGISQGAAISVEFAHRYPDRVSGLIILGGYAAGWRKFGDADLMRKREAMLELMTVGWGGDNPAFRQIYTNLFVPGGTPEQHEWFNELQRASASPENAARLLDAFGDIDTRPVLNDLTIPALVMHCRNDAIVPLEAGRQFAIHLPDARFVVLEGDNHVLLENDPGWPVFLREVRSFLAGL